MNKQQYSLYKGENEIAFGSLEEIANKMGVKKKSIIFYGTPTYAKRGTKKKDKINRMCLLKI